jgi:butyryl-CoA dehydrogenase
MWYMNEDRQLMLNVAKEFAEKEVRPQALQIDASDEFPYQLFKRAGELGFLGITMPSEYGGLGLDHTTAALVYEEIAKVSPVLTVNMGAHAMLAGGMIAMLGTPAQKEKYLSNAATGEFILACGSTESAGGDNHVEHTTKAVLDGDQWVINGGKVLISNIGVADAYVIFAITSKVDPVTRAGISAFLVDKDTPGLTIGSYEHKLGWHGSATGSISFQDMRIPKENLLGPEGGCMNAAAVSCTNEFLTCGPVALGISEAAYGMAFQYSLDRIQRGMPMYDRFQVTKFKLVKMRTMIEELRAFVYSTYAMKDLGELVLCEGRMMKIRGAEISEEICREAIQILGGVGVIRETGLERYWRDAKVLAIGGASVEALQDFIGTMMRIKKF